MASNQNNPSTGGAEPQQPLDRAAIRAAQNREAQRNFRLRKEARIKELEEIVRRSTTLAVAPSPREQQLLARIAELESENSRLRAQPYHHHHHPYVNHTQHVYHSYSQPVYHPYAYYPPPPPPPQLIHPYQQTHYSNTVPPPPMYSQTANPDYSSQNLPSLWNQYPVATPTLSNSLGLWPNIEAAEATLRSIPSLYNNPDVDLLCTLFKAQSKGTNAEAVGDVYLELLRCRNRVLDSCQSPDDRETVAKVVGYILAEQRIERLEELVTILADLADAKSPQESLTSPPSSSSLAPCLEGDGVGVLNRQEAFNHETCKSSLKKLSSLSNHGSLIDEVFELSDRILPIDGIDRDVVKARCLLAAEAASRLSSMCSKEDRAEFELILDENRKVNRAITFRVFEYIK